jgi:hypothetical protein
MRPICVDHGGHGRLRFVFNHAVMSLGLAGDATFEDVARTLAGLSIPSLAPAPSKFTNASQGPAEDRRKDGSYAGRVRLAVAADRSAESLCGFVESAVAPRTLVVTDDWSGYTGLRKRGYNHQAIAECEDPDVTDDFLPIIHLVFANLKTWLIGTRHGVGAQHLQRSSTSSRSASTGASTRSTPSIPCSESRPTRRRQPLSSFIPATGYTRHLVGVFVSRIGGETGFIATPDNDLI